jgi:hypothetical protein
MTPPDESFSSDVDLFRPEPPKLPDLSFSPDAYVVPRHRPERCHSMQLALVTGLFACGGLICSMFLVDGSDDFPRPRYWPRKSISSPASATPQRPVTAPSVPQNGTFKSNGDKNAVFQERSAGDAKTSGDHACVVRTRSSRFRPASRIVSWMRRASFVKNFRGHRITFDFVRNLAFCFRDRTRQHHFEAGCFSIRQDPT